MYALDVCKAMNKNPIEKRIKESSSAYLKIDTNLNKPNVVVNMHTHKGCAP